MSDETDLDLYQARGAGVPDPVLPPPSPISPWPVIGVVALLLVAAIAFFVTRHRTSSEPATVIAPTGREVPASPPASPRREVQTTLPPLAESDPAVRDIVGGLSRDPLVASWLAGDQLLRSAASVLSGVAEGRSPAALLRRLAPSGAFSVRTANGRTVIDPASYRRYDPVAAAAESVDPAAAARVYRTLAPRLDEAFKELGMPGTLDETVERAAHQVLTAPIVDGDIAVVPSGAVYAYADPALENLTPVAKLMVRMGPENARRIQEKIRAFLQALGQRPT
jgi:hypothetical protein